MYERAPAFDLDSHLEAVRAAAAGRFEVRTEATVLHRDRRLPILSLRSRADAARTLLVLSGIHGDEQAGLLAIPRLLEHAAWSEGGVRLVVVTPVNPVGASRCVRGNGEGRDVNRDFSTFATVEARAVRGVYDRERPDFVVSLHEGPQDGTFLFANRLVGAADARALLDALADGGTALAKRDYFGRRLDPPGLAPPSALTRAVWRLGSALGMQASIVFSEARGIPEIVIETPSRLADEDARIRAHVDVVLAAARMFRGF